MSNKFYSNNDNASSFEKHEMWNHIYPKILTQPKTTLSLMHWRSFWLGNAAAILIIFAVIGIFTSVTSLLNIENDGSSEEKMYQTLTSANDELNNLPPLIIDQASNINKASLESTFLAIKEIDSLIEEIKKDMIENGETPVKRSNLKRLYATKLDFYKELLLKEESTS